MTGIKSYPLKDPAKLLNTTERTLHNYMKSGKMKGQRIGGKVADQRKQSGEVCKRGVWQDDDTWILLICKVPTRGMK
jgi:hypothetical protein